MSRIKKTSEFIRPRKTLIYGTHGIGKSSFAAQFPSPIFLPTEDGIQDLRPVVDAFPLLKDYSEIVQAVMELQQTEHDYQTIVLDSADWAERLIWKDVANAAGKEDISEIGFGVGYGKAAEKFCALLASLDFHNRERGMNIVLIAHACVEKFSDPASDGYDRYQPKLHKRLCGVVQEWADEVLFCNYKVHTRKVDGGFNKTETKGIGQGERVLYTTERPSHLAKNRLNLPDVMPLNFNTYWNEMIAAIQSEANKGPF